MKKTERTNTEMTENKKVYYDYQDIMDIVGCSKSKSYEVISECNKILENKGFITFRHSHF